MPEIDYPSQAYPTYYTPDIAQTISAPSYSPMVSSSGMDAGMGWGSVATAAVSGIADYFGARMQASAKRAATKQGFAIDKYFIDQKRKDDLEKQAYKEHAIGMYRGFGTPGLTSPAYTDPSVINPVNPYPGKV